MKKIPCLAQYQGSKRLLSKQILCFFPKEVGTLFDPFCGLGSITIASAEAGIAKHYVMNDLNESVSDLLKSCIDNPTELCKEYEDIWDGQFDFPSDR
jgi:DNA adenine methylase